MKKISTLSILLLLSILCFSQYIPSANAIQAPGLKLTTTSASPSGPLIMDVQSTTKGVKFPKMTATQRLAIASPVEGLLVWDTDSDKYCAYDGAGWKCFGVSNFGGTISDPVVFNGRVTFNDPIIAADSFKYAIGAGAGAGSILKQLDATGLGAWVTPCSVVDACVVLPNSRVAIGSSSNTVGSDTSVRVNFQVGIPNLTVYKTSTGGEINTGILRLSNSSGNKVSLVTPNSFSNYTMTYPTTMGNSGEYLSTDGVNQLSWVQPPISGVYLPDTSNVDANVTAFTRDSAQYMRVGNVVTVSGQFTITTIASASFNLSVPIATNISRTSALAGSGTTVATLVGSVAVEGDVTGNNAKLNTTASLTAIRISYHYTYLIQ